MQDGITYLNDANNLRISMVDAASGLRDIISVSNSSYAHVLTSIDERPHNGSVPPSARDSQRYLSQAITQANSFISYMDTFDIGAASEDIRHYSNTYLSVSAALLVFFLLALCSLTVVNICSEKANRCIICFDIVSIIAFFTCISLAFYKYGMALGISDFCVVPNDWADAIGKHVLSADNAAVVSYYGYCVPGSVHPYASDLHTSSSQVNSSLGGLTDLRSFCASNGWPDLVSDIDNLKSNLTVARGQLDDFANTDLDCAQAHSSWVNLVTQACDPTLSNLYTVAASQVAAAILLLTARMCLPARSRFTEPSSSTGNNGEFDDAPTGGSDYQQMAS